MGAENTQARRVAAPSNGGGEPTAAPVPAAPVPLAHHAESREVGTAEAHRHDPSCGHLRRALAPTPPEAGIERGESQPPTVDALERLRGDGRPVEVPDRPDGLPAGLRRSMESMSGIALHDVRVRRSSPEPAKLGALAFARGTEIHLGPGQEKHLPHEAWHVVQQAQGRVGATVQAKGRSVNDSPALEREADEMGALAASRHVRGGGSAAMRSLEPEPTAVVQRVVTDLVSLREAVGRVGIAPSSEPGSCSNAAKEMSRALTDQLAADRDPAVVGVKALFFWQKVGPGEEDDGLRRRPGHTLQNHKAATVRIGTDEYVVDTTITQFGKIASDLIEGRVFVGPLSDWKALFGALGDYPAEVEESNSLNTAGRETDILFDNRNPPETVERKAAPERPVAVDPKKPAKSKGCVIS